MTQRDEFLDGGDAPEEDFSPEEQNAMNMFHVLGPLPEVGETPEAFYDEVWAGIVREGADSQKLSAKISRFRPIQWLLDRVIIELLERFGSVWFAWGYSEKAALCWKKGLRLAELSDNSAWAIALRALLRHQASAPLREALPQITDAHTPPRVVQGFDDVSSPWSPRWAGALHLVTASNTQPQEKTFSLATGLVSVTCQLWGARERQRSTLRLAWRANFPTPVELWLRFVKRDDPTVRLGEDIHLGRSLAGSRSLATSDLGFDPAEVPWALVIVLRPPQC